MLAMKRMFLRAAWALLTALAITGGAGAQTWPARPIRIVSPWPAGGVAEAVARLVADKLAAALGKPVIVDSVAGAGGTIGTAQVAKAAPDGYTVLFSHSGPMAMNPNLQPDLPYDPQKSFVPITQAVTAPMAMVIRAELPIRSVKEFIDYAKANPGKLNLGSIGQGSSTHLAGEMMKMMSGIDFVHVPYKGAAPVITDLLGGRVDFSFLNITGVQQYIEAGKVRVIGVTSAQRTATIPGVPAVAETIPGFDVTTWYGFEVPAGTPREIVTRLNTEITKILRMPDVVARLNQMTYDVTGTTPEQHAAKLREDLNRWGPVIKATGMKIE